MDVKGSELPSALELRKERRGYQQTQDYYLNNNHYEGEENRRLFEELEGGGQPELVFVFPADTAIRTPRR